MVDHFGILAPYYEHFIPARIPERLLALTSMPAGGLILDAGGGTGRIAQFFRDSASQVIIADQTFKMLVEAHKKDKIQPLCSWVERLPFPSGLFDRIIMVDAFHHVVDHSQTASELWRVLRPGGCLVIEEPDIDSFSVKLVAFLEKAALMRSHFLSPERIGSLFGMPGAHVHIEKNGSTTAWIVVAKGIIP